jgi:hypothetical protein
MHMRPDGQSSVEGGVIGVRADLHQSLTVALK